MSVDLNKAARDVADMLEYQGLVYEWEYTRDSSVDAMGDLYDTIPENEDLEYHLAELLAEYLRLRSL